MLKPEVLYRVREFWMERLQNDIYATLSKYQREHDWNQTELANHLGYSKGYVSQLLKGEFNHSTAKLFDLLLKMDKVACIEIKDVQDLLPMPKSGRVIDFTSRVAEGRGSPVETEDAMVAWS